MPETATANRCRTLPTGLALLLLLCGAPAAAGDPEPLPLPPPYPSLDTTVRVPTLEPSLELAPPPLTDAPPQRELRVPRPPEPEPPGDDEPVEALPPSPESKEHTGTTAEAIAPRAGDSADSVPRAVVSPAEPLAPPPIKTLEIVLDWYPGPQHAALLLASQNGQL
ncbi:MAG: hypothetical protein J5F18_11345, partial [Halomonas sp. BM-2019]